MPRRYFSLIFLSLIPPIDTSSGYLSFKRFIETLADAFWVPAADFIHFFFSVDLCAPVAAAPDRQLRLRAKVNFVLWWKNTENCSFLFELVEIEVKSIFTLYNSMVSCRSLATCRRALTVRALTLERLLLFSLKNSHFEPRFQDSFLSENLAAASS